jgi:hypothetical protein
MRIAASTRAVEGGATGESGASNFAVSVAQHNANEFWMLGLWGTEHNTILV